MEVIDFKLDRGEFLTNPSTQEFIKMIEQANAWAIFPYGEWMENGDLRVIFDRHYRPICRVFPDEQVQFIPSDEFIFYQSERRYHAGFGPRPDQETKAKTLAVFTRYGLEPELRRRRAFQLQGGRLPRAKWWEVAA